MSERLGRTFTYFDRTRSGEHPWLFVMEPGGAAPSLRASSMALGAYGELRAMGFAPPENGPWATDEEVLNAWTGAILDRLDPATHMLRVDPEDGAIGGEIASPERYVSSGFEWQLRNRVFMADVYRLPAGAQSNEDYLATTERALGWLEKTWRDWFPWRAGSWTSRAVETHMALRAERGEEPEDEVIDCVHHWLEDRQDAATGAWYSDAECDHHNVVNGIFKLFVTYERLGWEIPRQREIIDFVLGGTDPAVGFAGAGCSVFDPMQVLYVLRGRGCAYRAAEADEAAARSFLTFLANWDEDQGWFLDRSWNGKHNLGIPLYMASLLLDHPYMKINTIYNWREGPIVRTSPDGSVRVRDGITYATSGHTFTG